MECCPSEPVSWKTLCEVRCGQLVRVRRLASEATLCVRLREMGFCEDAEIVKLSQGGATLCQVCGTRVALSRTLARQILVEPV
jgi:Fe2+ transport system protein FeoA